MKGCVLKTFIYTMTLTFLHDGTVYEPRRISDQATFLVLGGGYFKLLSVLAAVTSQGGSAPPSSGTQVSGSAPARLSSATEEERSRLRRDRGPTGWPWRRTPLSQRGSLSEQLWAVCTCTRRTGSSRGRSPWKPLLQGANRRLIQHEAELRQTADVPKELMLQTN